MLVAIEGIAGAGKSTVRDRLLTESAASGSRAVDLGQFSWLDPSSTRTLIELRNGQRPSGSLDAALHDLRLHVAFNLAPARDAGPVLADRWVISTACLLAAINRRPVSYYLGRLAADEAAHPDITVLLNTPVHVCLARLWKRESPRRFIEEPGIANRLAQLYDDAAETWIRLTGKKLIRHSCRTSADLDTITRRCLTLIGLDASNKEEPCHAP